MYEFCNAHDFIKHFCFHVKKKQLEKFWKENQQ